MKIIYKLFLLTLPLLFTANTSYATGVMAEAQLGFPNVQIDNPDGSSAYYGGLSLLAKLTMPAYQTKNFGISITGIGRFLDINNNSNSVQQRETGTHIGPGLGVKLNFYRFFLGYDAYYMKARHFWVGTQNKYLEYSYNTSNIYGGIDFNFGKNLNAALSYSLASGNISKAETGLAADTPYSDSIIWLHIGISTGQGFGKFMSDIAN